MQGKSQLEPRAVYVKGKGGVEVLEVAALPHTAPSALEVRVDVVAVGLNRADILQRKGLYPAPADAPADILGLEFAGIVSEVGAQVTLAAVGERVMGIVSGGAMATQLVIHERLLLPVPDALSLEEAAAIPEAFVTAYDALTQQGQVQATEWVLIHAVTSGVGWAAWRLAETLGARVIGTSRSKDKLERCRALGLSMGLHTEDGRFRDTVVELTAGHGADVIIDLVGAAYLQENLRTLAQRGRCVIVGLLGGAEATLNLSTLLAKRGRLQGTVLRSRPLEEKMTLIQTFRRLVLPMFAQKKLGVHLERVLPMDDVAQAHALMESNHHLGKIVLKW